ncbi:putative transcription factor MYB family [Helianthus debilis subsp. tardiflorus]
MFGGNSNSSSSGGGDRVNNNETLTRLTHMMMTAPPPPPPQPPLLPPQAVAGGVGDTERVPMWSQQETRDLIAIRGGLEGDFTVAKRNKSLWEVVAARMKGLGYRRTPEQCKCKWKNLISRYKGKETSDRDNTRSFPFFNELHALFTERAANTPQTPFDPEAGSSQSKSRKRVARTDSYQSLEEISEDEDEYKDQQPRKKPDRGKQPQTSNIDKPATPKPSNSGNNSIQEILHDFFQQQQMIDMQWRQLMEKHAYERQMFEQEWRQSMERMERERMRTEQSWREKEEQRRIREEGRAERRDALLTLLLNKLVEDQ